MRSNSLDNKLRAKEVELKRHEQEIADQDEVWYFMILSFFSDYLEKKSKTISNNNQNFSFDHDVGLEHSLGWVLRIEKEGKNKPREALNFNMFVY